MPGLGCCRKRMVRRKKVIRVVLTRSSWQDPPDKILLAMRDEYIIWGGEETLPMSRGRVAPFILQCVSKTFYLARNVSLAGFPFQTIRLLLRSMQKSLLGLLKNCDTICRCCNTRLKLLNSLLAAAATVKVIER